jgi:chondroitin AC lyase
MRPTSPKRQRSFLRASSAAIAVALASRAAAGSDFSTVSQRVTAQILSSLPTDAAVQNDMATIQANGSWTDINYSDPGGASWSPIKHVDRLINMTQAYVSPSSSLYQNATLATDINNAYNYWIATDPQSANWWYNDIGSLQILGASMVLFGSNFSQSQINSGVTFLNRANAAIPTYGGGQNTVDLAYVGIYQAIVTSNTSTMGTAFNEINGTIAVTPAVGGIGIQYDNSFHEHGPQLYIGGYGQSYINDVLQTAAIAAGTAYAPTTAQDQIAVNYLLDGAQWFIRGQALDITAVGRNDSRAGISTAGTDFTTAISSALQLGTYRSTELQAFLNRQNAAISSGAASSTQYTLSGNRNFFDSDIMVQQRPGYYESVKTSSVRTSQPESGNGEGLTNLYLADGVNQVMVTGNEYANIEPVWNWRMLPGTTVEQDTRSLKPTSDGGTPGTTTFVGGVSDGTYGAEGFDYNRYDVAAKKSWFFFDNEQAALGGAIDSSSATYPVYTTLNQCLLTSTITYETAGGTPVTMSSGSVTPANLSWVYQGGVGYFFLSPVSNATILAQTQTGSWRLINNSQSSATVSQNVFTLFLNHGTTVSNGSYGYIEVPGITAAQMDSYAASIPIQVLANTANLQAVRQSALDITQASFYSAGSFTMVPGQTIAANGPSMVMFKRQPYALELSAANPQNAQLNLNVTLTGVTLSGSNPGWFDAFGNATAAYDLPGGNYAGATVGLTLACTNSSTPTVSLTSNNVSNYTYTVNSAVSPPGNITLQTDSLSTLAFAAPITGAVPVIISGAGTVNFGGANTYSGLTSVSGGVVNVNGNESAAGGGWSIGQGNAVATTVNFNSGSAEIITTGHSVILGTIPGGSQSGSTLQTLNVSGSVVNAGSLSIGRSGYLYVNAGGTWSQRGPLSIQPLNQSGYSAFLIVNSGGTFNYNGSSPINITPSISNGGNSTLNLLGGGTFSTNQPFSDSAIASGTGSSNGSSLIELGNGGTLSLETSIPSLFTTSGNTLNIQVGNGGGVINTDGFSTTIALPIGNESGQSGSFTKAGLGTLTLSAVNTYTGSTNLSGGTLLLTGTLNATALAFVGTGTFNANQSAGSSQSMGALLPSAGDGTIVSTYGGSGNTSLIFNSLSARSAGAEINLVPTGGNNGTTNQIDITGQSSGFINAGTFFNGSNYAWMNSSGGYVRGIKYGTDTGTATEAGGTSLSSSAIQQFTAPITAQPTATFTTINDAGNNAFTLAAGATLTVSGILKSGNVAGTTAVIGGGTALQAPANTDLIIRTDGPNDQLTINTPILANGTSSLTKSGDGTLTLGGANTYTGGLFVNDGTLRVNAIANFGNIASTLYLDAATVEWTSNSAATGRLVLLKSASSNFMVDSGATLTLSNIVSGVGTLNKTGPGTLDLTAANTYSGGTNISAGTLAFNSSGAYPAFTNLTINGGTAVAGLHGNTKNSLFTSGVTFAGSSGHWTGQLDLTNNDLLVRNGDLPTITSQIKEGFNASGTNWRGSGGITSSSAAADSNHLTALGVIQNSIDGTQTGLPIYSSFDGTSSSSADVLVKYTYFGDANLDGQVDGSDYSLIDYGYLSHLTGWSNGDFNYDGVIDGSDYALIDNTFNMQLAAMASTVANPTAAVTDEITSVPEPAAALWALVVPALLTRRERAKRDIAWTT